MSEKTITTWTCDVCGKEESRQDSLIVYGQDYFSGWVAFISPEPFRKKINACSSACAAKYFAEMDKETTRRHYSKADLAVHVANGESVNQEIEQTQPDRCNGCLSSHNLRMISKRCDRCGATTNEWGYPEITEHYLCVHPGKVEKRMAFLCSRCSDKLGDLWYNFMNKTLPEDSKE